MWITKEALERDWVISLFPNLAKLSKKSLLAKSGFCVVRDKYLKSKPHDPKTWVSGKEQRRETRSFFLFGSL